MTTDEVGKLKVNAAPTPGNTVCTVSNTSAAPKAPVFVKYNLKDTRIQPLPDCNCHCES